MHIRFLGTHNAESKNTRLSSFLIDGILAVETGNLTTGLSFSEQEKIQTILLSHGHYDHIRGLPAFAFNNYHRTTRVFAHQDTLDVVTSHLMDGLIYPRFNQKTDFTDKPALELLPLELFKAYQINGYRIQALPVNHSITATGFEIYKDGKSLFYTGDTGPGLHALWDHISPQCIIMDLTYPNSAEKAAWDAGHLCPDLLKNELMKFQQVKGYLPRVILIHLSPRFEKEIRREVLQAAAELETTIDIAPEGNELIM